MKTKYFYYIILLILYVSIAIFSGLLGWINQFVILGLLYYSIPIIIKRFDFKPFYLLCILPGLPFVSIMLFLTLRDKLWHVVPLELISIIGFSLSILIIKFKKSTKIKVFIIYSISILLFGYIGMPNWITYTLYKPQYLSEPLSDYPFINDKNDTVYLKDNKGKIIVLEFWNIYCAACFKKIPEFEKFYIQNKNNKDIAIYSVNIMLPGDSLSNNKKIAHKFYHSFPVLYTTDYKEFNDKFKIRSVPNIIIIDKKGIIRFRGSFNQKPWIFVGNIDDVIDEINQ